MQLQPGREDVHPEPPQDVIFGALTASAEALEQLTEACLVLPPDASNLVRHRLREAVGKASESFRFMVSACHAYTRSEPGRMRPEYDFAEGIRGAVCPRPEPRDPLEPVTATRDLEATDEGPSGEA